MFAASCSEMSFRGLTMKSPHLSNRTACPGAVLLTSSSAAAYSPWANRSLVRCLQPTLRPKGRISTKAYANGELSVSEAAAAALNNNQAFKAILAESLARSGGAAALFEGAKPKEPERSMMEVLLTTAIDLNKLSQSRLLVMQNEIGRLVDRESKQLERLQFTLAKCKTDQAYFKSLQMVLEEGDKGAPSCSLISCQLVSPMEELLMTAVDSSRTSLGRLQAMQTEIKRTLEREVKQLEHLEFATTKAINDEAYYRSLQMILEEGSDWH